MKIYKIASGNKFWLAPNGDIVYVDRHSSWTYNGKRYQYGKDDLTGWNRGLIDSGKIFVSYPSTRQGFELIELADSKMLPVVYYDRSNIEREYYNPKEFK